MVDVARLRGIVEIQGARQAEGELYAVGRAFDSVARQSGQSASGFAAFDRRVKEIQANARASQASITQLGTAVHHSSNQARDAQGRFASLSRGVETSGRQAAAASGNWRSLTQGIQQLSPIALGTTGAVVGLGMAAQASVNASIDWESALAGVAKTLDTTGLSAEEAEEAVAQIGDELRQMALEIPITAVELAAVAEAAGQLGVAREDVVSFTETMAKLGVTTDLTAEQAAVAIARISNITGLASEDIDNFASALVDLGNNSAATEREILNMATRIAAAGSQAGLTEGEILGLSAALTSVGINAEAGGTAISQVMAEITESVETVDDRLELFAEVAGMTAERFAETWRSAPAAAIAAFVEGLAEIEASGGSSVLVLQELELAGIRQSQALRSAAGAGDLMRESMERGNRAMDDGVALNREAAVRFETTASKIQLAKNEMRESAIVLGDELAPAFLAIMDAAAKGTGALTELVRLLKETGEAAVEVSGGGPRGGAGLGDYLLGLESAFRLASGGSKDLTEDLRIMTDTLLLGRPAFEGTQEAAEGTGEALRAVAQLVEETLGLVEETLGSLMGRAGQTAEEWAEQLLSVRGQVRNLTKEQAELLDLQLLEANMLHDISAATGLYASQLADANRAAFDLASMTDNLHAVNVAMNARIDEAAGAISHWEDRVKGVDQALEYLDEQLAAGNITAEEHAEKVDKLTWFNERLKSGIQNDLVPAYIDEQLAAADLQLALDELNEKVKNNEISQADAEEQARALREEFEKQHNPIGTLIDKIQELIDTLIELEDQDPTINIDADLTPAYAAVEGFKAYLAANPATIDLYVGQNNTIGFTTKAEGGPIRAGQLALVGEEGPELIVPEGDVHVFSNPETRELLGLLGSFVGGFQEGTGSLPDGGGTTGEIDVSGFTSLGEMIAEAIALGVQLGLIESGEPTGSEYARAIIAGVEKDAGRLPELAADLSGDVVVALLEQYDGLEGQLQLAILSGEDTTKIQQQLDIIFQIFAAWSGNTVEEVEAVWDAIADEQRAQAAQQMWERVVGSIALPSAPASFSLEDIISGDALAQIRADFIEIWNLQEMLREAGFTEEANALGEQLKALGMQEEFINALLGTDVAQRLAEKMELEELGKELDARLDVVLGDDPLAMADRIQGEIDSLQAKIDMAPILGIPQEIVDGWLAEQEALKEQQDQFWADMAAAWEAGLLDPTVLAELDEAGQIAMGEAIMGMFGPQSLEMFEQQLREFGQLGEAGVAQLAEIFESAPEIAKDMVDDIIAAVQRGELSFSDAMELLANVPEKDLIPALAQLDQALTVDLAEAILKFGPDSPEVQAILAGLGLIDEALVEITGSSEAAAKAVENAATSAAAATGPYGSPAFDGEKPPGSGGGDGTAKVGASYGARQALRELGITLAPGEEAIFRGLGPRIGGRNGMSLWAHLRDEAILVIDKDGLTTPRSGFTVGSDGDQLYINPFAEGGIVTEPTLALVGEAGTEGIFPLERAQEFGFGGMTREDKEELARMIARAMAAELQKAPIRPQLDGREISRGLVTHLNSGALVGQAVRSR